MLAELEEDEPDKADVFIIPPDEGVITDEDSDKSDEEHEGNPNHFGPATLRAECEAVIHTRIPPEYDSEDELPLSHFVLDKSEKQPSKKRR